MGEKIQLESPSDFLTGSVPMGRTTEREERGGGEGGEEGEVGGERKKRMRKGPEDNASREGDLENINTDGKHIQGKVPPGSGLG